jgi:hypothetical protein
MLLLAARFLVRLPTKALVSLLSAGWKIRREDASSRNEAGRQLDRSGEKASPLERSRINHSFTSTSVQTSSRTAPKTPPPTRAAPPAALLGPAGGGTLAFGGAGPTRGGHLGGEDALGLGLLGGALVLESKPPCCASAEGGVTSTSGGVKTGSDGG